jgi:hypothetical protein
MRSVRPAPSGRVATRHSPATREALDAGDLMACRCAGTDTGGAGRIWGNPFYTFRRGRRNPMGGCTQVAWLRLLTGGHVLHDGQLGLSPAVATIVPYRVNSLRKSASNALGSLPTTSSPSGFSRLTSSGSASAFTIAAFNVAVT